MKKSYRAAAWPRRWCLPIALLVGTLAGLVVSMVKEPVYSAEAYVTVVPTEGDDMAQAVNYAQAYARIVTQPGVLATDDEVRAHVQSSASPDAPLVRVAATAPTAADAAERANGVADNLTAYANLHSADTRMRVAGFARAFPPSAPSSPIPLVNIAVGAATGVLVGGLAFLAPPLGFRRRRRVRPRAEPAKSLHEVGV
ncbi:Wzz/FepE/Etk N-terminal domain-containing protein [Nonomuraea sp. NPDC046570]|uniref:Wzz/FepE/Etk N-terminal domain-containing protein n=1 Tax=Nonomuraea sp. NPDC046570 TaxID=3155255 RepID=UPI00340D6652